jgi:hypothetical protein
VLLGNSGVGKSSLAQAGVLAALKRQAWPEGAGGERIWPHLTRRAAPRSEFSEAEWRLVSELADYPHRLLVTATPEGGETYAEIAHEAIFRRWSRLREWLAAEREFLIWKSELEAARRRWEQAPAKARDDALLMGRALAQAQGWFSKRAEDLSRADREFIANSLQRDQLERQQKETLRRRVLISALVVLVLMTVAAIF